MATTQHTINLDQVALTAKRELAAFVHAVSESYGPAEAEIAAGDWLDALESAETTVGAHVSDWRQLTISASCKLAARLIASGRAVKPTEPIR